MKPLPRANRERWSAVGTDPVAAARSEAAAKARGLSQWAHEMSQVVGDDLVQALVRDGRSWARGRSAFTARVDQPAPSKPIDPVPLSSPPGISVIDRLCEEAARQEYEAELARRLDVAAKLKGIRRV
jgi:hypothetical protein